MCVCVCVCVYVCQHFQTSSPQKPLGQSKSNFIWSLNGMGERKFIQLVQVTWPRWPPCPNMVKTFKKSSSPEPKGRWPCNLVCSIGCSGTIKFVQMMILGWSWPILRQGQIWFIMLLYGKKIKQWIFQNLLYSMMSKLVDVVNKKITWTYIGQWPDMVYLPPRGNFIDHDFLEA